MKKVLIIAYYWPPSGGGGVQRWLKMTKYIHEFGWQPVIYTPEGGEAPVIDESLLNEVSPHAEVVKQPIWEPYSFYKRFTGKKKEQQVYSGFISEGKKPGLTQQVSVWIRGNMFIPDARKFWINPSIRFLKKYLKENPVDAIVSTGPPHSMHLIALGIKKHFDIPWIADFRDPWTRIDFYDQLMLTGWADRKHHRQELAVLNTANEVVTVTWSWADDFRKIGNREIKVITNGFDPADFPSETPELDKKFSICHIGSMNKDRNPTALWKALKELIEKDEELRTQLQIRLIGQVDQSIINAIHEHGLESFLEKIDFMPHDAVIKNIQQSQVLLLPLNRTFNVSGVVPGKLYEYLGAQRPILCLGPTDGDAARIITESSGGVVAGFDDQEKVKQTVQEFFRQYQNGNLSVNTQGIMKYSRKELAHNYADLLNQLIA